MTTTTLERPALNLETADLESSEHILGFKDIVSAEDPQIVFDRLANDPEKVGQLLGEAEAKLAEAGAELKINLMTPGEQQEYALAKNEYEIIIGLIAERDLQKAVDRGPDAFDEIDSKKAMRLTLIKSMKQVYGLDHEYREKHSSLERGAEEVAKTRLRRFMGKAAGFLFGVSGGWGLRKVTAGVKAGTELWAEAAPALTELAFTSTDHLTKQSLSLLTGLTDSRVDRYVPTGEVEREPGLNYNTDPTEADFVPNTQSTQDAEEKLALMLGDQRLDRGVSVKQLVEYSTGIVGSSLDEFYGVSDSGDEAGVTDNVEGAFASAPLDLVVHDDASPETSEMIESAKKTAGYYFAQLREARRNKSANAVDNYPPDDVQ